MVEVQVRVDHERDVLEPVSGRADPVLQVRASAGPRVFDAVDAEKLLVLLVPGARVDQHEPDVVLDEQAAHAQGDAVPLVGGDAPLPERLRDDAEHGAAIESLPARLDRVHAPAPHPARLDERRRRAHAVVSRSTGRGIALRRRRRARA